MSSVENSKSNPSHNRENDHQIHSKKDPLCVGHDYCVLNDTQVQKVLARITPISQKISDLSIILLQTKAQLKTKKISHPEYTWLTSRSSEIESKMISLQQRMTLFGDEQVAILDLISYTPILCEYLQEETVIEEIPSEYQQEEDFHLDQYSEMTLSETDMSELQNEQVDLLVGASMDTQQAASSSHSGTIEDNIEKVCQFINQSSHFFQGIIDSAKEKNIGIKVSRKIVSDLPFSVTITPSATFLLHVKTPHTPIVGKGHFKEIKELYDLQTTTKVVISAPVKNEKGEYQHLERFEIDIAREGEIYQRFSGQIGFPVCHAVSVINYGRENDVDIKPRGLILDKYEYNGLQFFNGKIIQSLPLEQANEIKKNAIQQLIDAVENLHRHGIAHCDLKMDNFLINIDGILALIDFGCSLDHRKRVPEGYIPGDLTTRPPELLLRKDFIPEIKHHYQLKSRSEYYFQMGKQQDVWALGIILYNIAKGEHAHLTAFRGHLDQLKENTKKLLQAPSTVLGYLGFDLSLFKDVDDFQEAVPKTLAGLIRRMISVDYKQRPTMQQVKEWVSSPDFQFTV